jgi:hypothetical protein
VVGSGPGGLAAALAAARAGAGEERANAMGAAMPDPQSLSHSLNAEVFKYVADVLVQEAGVQPLMHQSLQLAPRTSHADRRGFCQGSKRPRTGISGLSKRGSSSYRASCGTVRRPGGDGLVSRTPAWLLTLTYV